MTPLFKPAAAIDGLVAGSHRIVDVRSEGEFAKASVPGTLNSPILNDAERHAVGLCYKLKGQSEAISLGHELVDPLRAERVADWIHKGEPQSDTPLLITCWRGGMRSQFATEWVREAGRDALRIEGGYKALRAELMSELQAPKPFLVLSGRTGSGKTQLLKEIPILEKIDIEDLAAHRGSSFGKMWDREQPAQATFENALALGLWRRTQPIVVEDESKVIGKLHLPEPFYRSMATSPIVQVEVKLEERARTIFEDYVRIPSQNLSDPKLLKAQLIQSLEAIRRRLGGALTDELLKRLRSAFQAPEPSFEKHQPWIEGLLHDYYDRAYDHSSDRNPRTLAFQGDYEECKAWICSRYA